MELSEPLPSRARYLHDRATQEREHGTSWSTDFPENMRNRLNQALLESIGGPFAAVAFDTEVRGLLQGHSQHRFTVVSSSLLFNRSRSNEEMVDALDASALALKSLADSRNGRPIHQGLPDTFNFQPDAFVNAANDIFLEGRIDYKFVDGRLKPRGSTPLHEDVIRPAEATLTSNVRFSQAELAYQEAVTAMATGHYGASITSAGSALQSTLSALGAQGQNLGALFADARDRGFLKGHDERLVSSYKSIGAWITADRTNRGNAHGAAAADRNDAELAIHIVAALIVRLVQVTPVTED